MAVMLHITLGRAIAIAAIVAAPAGVFASTPVLAPASDQPSRVVLSMCVSARVTPYMLRLAQDTAGDLFRKAGVSVEWIGCELAVSLQRELEPRAILIAPVSEVPAPLKSVPRMLGAVMRNDAGDEGVWAVVPRIERMADRYGAPPGVVLGHVIAHEVGHLLLPRGHHSVAGLMVAQWTGDDFVRAAQGHLTFSATDARRIRERLDAAHLVAPVVASAGASRASRGSQR
jgi:hypothetical protein